MSDFMLPSNHPFHYKNILALDYGDKFIGLAIFCVNRDPFPNPYDRISNTSLEYVLNEIRKIIENEGIDILVVGIPYLTDGQSTSTTRKVENFIHVIRDKLTLPIYTQDETLSTYEAESRMKNSARYNFKVDLKMIDAVSATVILEDFIRRSN